MIRTLFRRIQKKHTQPTIYPDDVFLVSYPKSGNTWVRFIIANLLKSNDTIIDFHNAIDYVPEIGVHDNILATLSRPRIIKSHQLYNRDFSKVIYIVRDPRDVYVSYYHYRKKHLPKNTNFSDFLRSQDIYPSRWHTHVESWLDRDNLTLLVKYEDLLLNPGKEVSKITNIISNKPIESSKINLAIESSSVENMRKIEQAKGRPFLSQQAANKAGIFVRKGTKGDWKQYFSKADEEFLLNEAGVMMKRLGYV